MSKALRNYDINILDNFERDLYYVSKVKLNRQKSNRLDNNSNTGRDNNRTTSEQEVPLL